MKQQYCWKVVSASVQGSMHKEEGNIPCQDSSYYYTEDDLLIAVVSDGAGSAEFAEYGSKATCKVIVDYIKENLSKGKDRKELVSRAIDRLRHYILTTEDKNLPLPKDRDLFQFHATVVGIICEKNKGIMFHIGDGSACACDSKNYEDCVISKPENGEFSNITYFFSIDDWFFHLRFEEFENKDLILLMTDGTTPFSMEFGYVKPEAKFISPVDNFLLKNPKYIGEKALATTLSSPSADKISQDDKTLFWARKILKKEVDDE